MPSAIAPLFQQSRDVYPDGGYLEIHSKVGSMIDWYNIQVRPPASVRATAPFLTTLQYYSQYNNYSTCETIFSQSDNAFPETSIFQIHNNGVELNKLVMGKLGSPADGGTGYIDPAVLGEVRGAPRRRLRALMTMRAAVHETRGRHGLDGRHHGL